MFNEKLWTKKTPIYGIKALYSFCIVDDYFQFLPKYLISSAVGHTPNESMYQQMVSHFFLNTQCVPGLLLESKFTTANSFLQNFFGKLSLIHSHSEENFCAITLVLNPMNFSKMEISMQSAIPVNI